MFSPRPIEECTSTRRASSPASRIATPGRGEEPAEKLEHLPRPTRASVVKSRRVTGKIDQALLANEQGTAMRQPGVTRDERGCQPPHEDRYPVQIGAAERSHAGQALQKGLAGELVPLDKAEALFAAENLGQHPPDEDHRVQPVAPADRDDSVAQSGVTARREDRPGIPAGRSLAETVFLTGCLRLGVALKKSTQRRKLRGGVNGTPRLAERLDGKTGELRKGVLEFGPETVACAAPRRRHDYLPLPNAVFIPNCIICNIRANNADRWTFARAHNYLFLQIYFFNALAPAQPSGFSAHNCKYFRQFRSLRIL